MNIPTGLSRATNSRTAASSRSDWLTRSCSLRRSAESLVLLCFQHDDVLLETLRSPVPAWRSRDARLGHRGVVGLLRTQIGRQSRGGRSWVSAERTPRRTRIIRARIDARAGVEVERKRGTGRERTVVSRSHTASRHGGRRRFRGDSRGAGAESGERDRTDVEDVHQIEAPLGRPLDENCRRYSPAGRVDLRADRDHVKHVSGVQCAGRRDDDVAQPAGDALQPHLSVMALPAARAMAMGHSAAHAQHVIVGADENLGVGTPGCWRTSASTSMRRRRRCVR